ncbi:MAG: chromosome segregation protein SMC [Legionella sp.]
MHLKQLKLSGFKSFVDPTVIPFPSQLVAVVGPNGCGKSNIIDAVRWVMGESSARSLRGESMTDVIFKGSSNRKPVGQASIELTFDNSKGRLTGQYASYQEIAVKRTVTKDGESTYYLNGARCRRRDINDLFLGTGAGARGYSIIGQDMISKLIEARPEELRLYLEEAAGVSKYKERRRETLQRITQTRENLERVADIREELDKQLQRLERQAKAAERYQSLKQQERLLKTEILALKWQAISNEQASIAHQLTQLTGETKQYQTTLEQLSLAEFTKREALEEVNRVLQDTQTTLYQLGMDIARLEESLLQQKRERERLLGEQQQLQAELQATDQQLEQEKENLSIHEQSCRLLEQQLRCLKEKLLIQTDDVEEKQQVELAWNNEWQLVETRHAEMQRDVQMEQLRLQHLEEQLQQISMQLDKIRCEQKDIFLDDLKEELSVVLEEEIALTTIRDRQVALLDKIVDDGRQLQQQLAMNEQQLHPAQQKFHSLALEHGICLAAQQSELQTTNQLLSSTLWEKKQRLVEVLNVPEQWLRACELVLGDGLSAIVLESLDDLLSDLSQLHGCSALFVTPLSLSATSIYPRLTDKLTGIFPQGYPLLDNVFAADNLDTAFSWLPTLTAEQSIVTPDGYWIGKGWLRIAGSVDNQQNSVLIRQQNLMQLRDALQAAQSHLDSIQGHREQLQQLLSANSDAQREENNKLALTNDALRDCMSKLYTKQRLLDAFALRSRQLDDDLIEFQEKMDALAEDIFYSRQKLDTANLALEQVLELKEQLRLAKTVWVDALSSATQEINTLKTEIHHTELRHEREKLKAQQVNINIDREQQRREKLQLRFDVVVNELAQLMTPDSSNKLDIEEKMQQYQELESLLDLQREQANQLQMELSEQLAFVRQYDQDLKKLDQELQQLYLQEQAQTIHANTLVDALRSFDTTPELVLTTMLHDISLSDYEQQLSDTEEKIKRLGAINLIAIDEYQTEQQRKQNLDQQYHDLNAAIAILDSAIAKMDKETESRLQETFAQINSSFQTLFPRLFGGGRAQLSLTCDNLLDAGILVMAQPPGKRNSTIHLLSGGEKALTAVALVFAIFQLNPSPFCMLDEVDAPLDDVNVRRFCDLVKEMSIYVQFLFITHNKVTMELADHLIGVTMREPGVSRVVAVDVEHALSIAE